jgi:hypothetical protein
MPRVMSRAILRFYAIRVWRNTGLPLSLNRHHDGDAMHAFKNRNNKTPDQH